MDDTRELKKPNAEIRPKTRRPFTKILVAAVVGVVVLALALGLGLGLGLKHHHSSDTGNNNNEQGISLSSHDFESWGSAVPDYNLDLDDWDFAAAPTTRTYNFTAREIAAYPDGVNRTVLTINGQFPGPLIRMNRGDRLLVYYTNQMSNDSSIHWHGMYQNGTNWMDGTTGITQCPVAPGQSFLYNFTVPNQAGTYWWHAHKSTQYVDGIQGPLIIHTPDEAQSKRQYDYDQVIMVQDWYHDLTPSYIASFLAPDNENAEPVPDSGLIQGKNYFNCSTLDPADGQVCFDNSTRPIFSVQEGKKYRLRFINSGAFTTFQISTDNHTMSIIEADGTNVEPLAINRLAISTAQRYSVIFTANQTNSTNYWMRINLNTNCYAADNDILDSDMKALITYTNSTAEPLNPIDWPDAYDVTCADLNNTLLTPIAVEQAPPAKSFYQLSFSFAIGNFQLDRARVNGTSWIPSLQNPTISQALTTLHTPNSSKISTSGVVTSDFSADQLVISISENEVVDLLVQNYDDGSHPFHFHGHTFWVMATSNELYFPWSTDTYALMQSNASTVYTANPMRRDTLTISAYGWALLRFRNDNPGIWAFHCHNAWHMEAGLMAQVLSLAQVMKGWTLPSDVQDLCKR